MKVLTGNLLESEAQTLVNTVNCVGIMGKGIALQFKKSFPEMFVDYAQRCASGQVQLGRPYLFRGLIAPWILNFPTKDHWRSLARLSDIEDGLDYLEQNYREWGITSIAVPPLGCGNGQLEWRVVGPTLYRHLERLDIPVELYAPAGTPMGQLEISFLDSDQGESSDATPSQDPEWVKPAWVALAEIVHRLDEQPYHWPIGRTIFQKIAYVATALGLPTGLKFERGSYGPFSGDVKRMQSRLMGNGLLSEDRRGSMLNVTVGSTFEDAQKSYGSDLRRWDDQIERTVDLFMRISNTDQAELVATVIYTANELNDNNHQPSETDVYDAVLSWKARRKPPIEPSRVTETIRTLSAQNWINVQSVDGRGCDESASFA